MQENIEIMKNKVRYFVNEEGGILFVVNDPKMFGVQDIIELVYEDERINNVKYIEIQEADLPEKYKGIVK